MCILKTVMFSLVISALKEGNTEKAHNALSLFSSIYCQLTKLTDSLFTFV